MSRKIYDYVVIGAGLNALLTAQQLNLAGYSVHLIEASDSLGASLKSSETRYGHIGGNYFSPINNDMAVSAIATLNLCLPFELEYEKIDQDVITFEAGKFQEFVGFGEKAPKYIDQIEYYLKNQRLRLSTDWQNILNALTNNVNYDLSLKSQVTGFEFEEDKIKSVIINGDKKIKAEEFIFTANPILLSSLLSEEHLGTRNQQKLAKAKLWTCICLDFIHKGLASDREEIHMLMAGTENAKPLVGKFTPVYTNAKGEVLQKSQWLSFIPGELTEDPESSGQLLREIKKQIKRAYPEILNSLAFEKLSLYPNSHGRIELRLNQQMKLSNLQNLWITSAKVSSFDNIIGSIAQSSLFLAHLGIEPQRPEVEFFTRET